MSEWLDLMIEEISRKRNEQQEAADEQRRRADAKKSDAKSKPKSAD